MTSAIAHHREADQQSQPLRDHLDGVSAHSRNFAGKLGIASAGDLIGLLHDLGKYSDEFQNYLKSGVGLLNQDEDEEFVDAQGLKGKVDHSTAGAQFIWQELSSRGQIEQIVGQILALCIASHHSGLIDCLTSKPNEPVEDGFTRRMRKSTDRTHLAEVLEKVDGEILTRARDLLAQDELVSQLQTAVGNILVSAPGKGNSPSVVAQFQIGLLVRILFSCLIDGDRLDSADFEKPWKAMSRQNGKYVEWKVLVERLETHLASFPAVRSIDEIRREISIDCLAAAAKPRGTFSLTVPTGGGKTLASLRFALHHARRHQMERIIYVIPFTSIIDQNADVVRNILEPDGDGIEPGQIVLEHHSNLTPEAQSWQAKLLTDNWDAPIVYTTSVQLLEALFGGGTRGARRMHQLANAVIVFDEIQTLPIKCVHLFNNAVNFLVTQCGSTVVLGTATQPLLDQVDPNRGAIANSVQMTPRVQETFEALRRVDVIDQRKAAGWSAEELAGLTITSCEESGSTLAIVNTKKMARAFFLATVDVADIPAFHLSTSMCPVHRRQVLLKVRNLLATGDHVICVSTQLIEAGVDVDFGTVVRSLAGLDSVAQAAGRCNRNGKRSRGTVHIVNPQKENLSGLEDIRKGSETTKRILDDFRDSPERYLGDIIGPTALEEYYKYYFFDRKDEMSYRVTSKQCGRDDTLLNLLSVNEGAVGSYVRSKGRAPDVFLRQSFMTAGKVFQAIDAPTRGVIIPFGKEGRDLVNQLAGSREMHTEYALLRQAQQFTVNLFERDFGVLLEQNALLEVQKGSGIFYLDGPYYSARFGLSTSPVPDDEESQYVV